MQAAIKALVVLVAALAINVAAALEGGSRIKPRTNLSVRSSPPGFFQSQGMVVGTVTPGDTLLVLEERKFPGVGGGSVWLRIEKIGDAQGAQQLRGWIFSGSLAAPAANVQPAR